MMKEKSIEANLSQIYTSHCIRATSMTLLDRAGLPLQRIRNGHRNEGRVKVYSEEQNKATAVERKRQCDFFERNTASHTQCFETEDSAKCFRKFFRGNFP